MALRNKVEAIVIEMLEGKDKAAIGKEIKEKIGSELVKELTKQFESKFNKFLTLKGEEYIKPLIVNITKEMIVLEKYKDHEKDLKKIVKGEVEKYYNEQEK